MKTLKITKSDTYAHPHPHRDHISVKKGEVVSLEDAVADRIIGHGGGELTDEAPDKTQAPDPDGGENSAWVGDVAAAMAKNHSAVELQEACGKRELDTKGNKSVLATRLVDAGVTSLEESNDE